MYQVLLLLAWHTCYDRQSKSKGLQDQIYKINKKILGKPYVGMLHISNTQQSAQIPLEDIGMHVTSVQKNMRLEAFLILVDHGVSNLGLPFMGNM